MEDETPKRVSKLIGNQFWKLRTVVPKGRIFADGPRLWHEACLYFAWCDANPWMRAELVKSKLDAEEYNVPLGRPYTMDGLTVFLGVSGAYFRAAKSNLLSKKKLTEAEQSILDAIADIESTIRNQQIEGAAVGVFNANLVSRLNGLADNVNNANTGETVVRVTVRDEKTAKALEELDDLL